VNSTVPGHVEESGQPSVVPGAHPAQAVAFCLRPPVMLPGSPGAKALRVKSAYLGVAEQRAPLSGDHRATVRPGAPAEPMIAAWKNESSKRFERLPPQVIGSLYFVSLPRGRVPMMYR
jgi:hypothetical protein